MNHRRVAALFFLFASLAAAMADATVRQAFLTSVAGPAVFRKRISALPGMRKLGMGPISW